MTSISSKWQKEIDRIEASPDHHLDREVNLMKQFVKDAKKMERLLKFTGLSKYTE